MIRLLLVSLVVFSALTLMATPEAAAQSPDRAELQLKIESLRDQVQKKQTIFLAPSAEDLAAYSEFLKQPDTGMARLMPREKYENTLLIRGGGAYYSFARLTNEYGFGSDIELQRGRLSVGFAGADFGFLTSLGDVPLDTVMADQVGVRFLSSFVTPLPEPEARVQQRRASDGFQADGFNYRDSVEAALNTTYALRSVGYNRSDLLVAVRVTRQDADGSLILVWKILRKYPVPRLAF